MGSPAIRRCMLLRISNRNLESSLSRIVCHTYGYFGPYVPSLLTSGLMPPIQPRRKARSSPPLSRRHGYPMIIIHRIPVMYPIPTQISRVRDNVCHVQCSKSIRFNAIEKYRRVHLLDGCLRRSRTERPWPDFQVMESQMRRLCDPFC